jgi:O-antigen/teichoic acid export membrane protein
MILSRTVQKAFAGRGGMYRRIARNSALFASGMAVSSLFTMLAVAIAARALPARHFGVLVLLQSAVLMLRALATFSTQQPVIKLGADAQAAGDRERLGAIISMGLVVDMVASLLAFAVAALCIEMIAPSRSRSPAA